jgi:hypothetical protein
MSKFKQLNENELMEYIEALADEFMDDYIISEDRRKRFIEQVYDTTLGTCESLNEVTQFVDGLLIGWRMER